MVLELFLLGLLTHFKENTQNLFTEIVQRDIL